MSAPLQLLAEGLSRSFGDREVVRKVASTLSPGEVVGLLGPNGAGKTTIFRMLSGALRPSQGTVKLDAVGDHALASFSSSAKGSDLFATGGFCFSPSLRVAEYRAGARNRGVPIRPREKYD